jgi:acetyl-CoA acetyltransferase
VIGDRNAMKDLVAVAAAATTGFEARNTGRSQASFVADACMDVLRACGLSAADVDGLCGSTPPAPFVQQMLGIPDVSWFATPVIPFGNHLAAAASAVHSGLCDMVLAYHGSYRLPWNTGSASKDPFRRGVGVGGGEVGPPGPPESIFGSAGYTAWASRYMYEFGVPKEHFGYVAINDRTNAARNPGAAMRTPITMDDYLSARMVRWPLCLLDMDVAVDGADAFVITTAERARDMPLPPVLIHALSLGMIDANEEDQTPSLRRHGQHPTIAALRAKSDFWIDDIDVYFPYDGFTVITLNWFENMGFCGPGEAGAFISDNWDRDTNRILLGGRVPVNPHGGALSEGATQGSGHVREAVHQLQGLAGERQVDGADRALLTLGGFFFNSQGIALRRHDRAEPSVRARV